MRFFAPDTVGSYRYFAPDDAPTGLTAVTSDLACSYAVRAAVSADLAGAYGVRGAVFRDLAAGYAVRARVSRDLAFSYQVLAGGGVFPLPVDASKVPSSRVVIFQGGTRLVHFDGGTRVVAFGSEKENSPLMAADSELTYPYYRNGKWMINKDPEDKRYYVGDITKDLFDSNTTASSVECIVAGVSVLEAAVIQGSLIVVKLGGLDTAPGAVNYCTFRVTCANSEQLDRTIYFARVDN